MKNQFLSIELEPTENPNSTKKNNRNEESIPFSQTPRSFKKPIHYSYRGFDLVVIKAPASAYFFATRVFIV